jgi:hypothetical protein
MLGLSAADEVPKATPRIAIPVSTMIIHLFILTFLSAMILHSIIAGLRAGQGVSSRCRSLPNNYKGASPILRSKIPNKHDNLKFFIDNI